MNRKRWSIVGSGAAFVALASVIVWASVGFPQAPTPSATPAAVSNYELNGFADAPPKPTPEPVVAAPEPVVEPAPEVAPVSGRKVPWIPSDDPQNAAGGDWDMSVCEGGSASTGADGTPYCD